MLLPEIYKLTQILCIECEDALMFTELIQVAQGKPFLWVRPLALKVDGAYADMHRVRHNSSVAATKLYDLRQNVDLFLPSSLFRACYDTEFISMLEALEEIMPRNAQGGDRELAHQVLQDFARRLWQIYPEQF